MTNPDDKGSFKTNISDALINAALESVEKHSKRTRADTDAPAEGELGAEPGTDPGAHTDAHTSEIPLEVESPDTESMNAMETLRSVIADRDSTIEGLNQQLEVSLAKGRELMGKLKDEHDKMLRSAADLENYKKRAAREKDEVQKYGIERLLKDFLPIIDNLERALAHGSGTADIESFRQGVALTRKQFEDTLAKHGVKSVPSHGLPFDPNVHEAMQQIETDALPPNHVAEELVRAFFLNDRLIRPALVAVSKAKPPADQTGPTDASAATPGEPT